MKPNKCERCGKGKENIAVHDALPWEDPCDNLTECRRDSTLTWFLCRSCMVGHISYLVDHWVEADAVIQEIKELIKSK